MKNLIGNVQSRLPSVITIEKNYILLLRDIEQYAKNCIVYATNAQTNADQFDASKPNDLIVNIVEMHNILEMKSIYLRMYQLLHLINKEKLRWDSIKTDIEEVKFIFFFNLACN